MSLRPTDFLKSIADGVSATAGAAVASQVPEFVQQYLQRLGGHRDEAARFIHAARTQGAAVSESLVNAAQARFNALTETLNAIAGAGDLERPLVFLRYLDVDIARATWEAFRPALPLTLAGFVYAGVGIVLGVALFNILTAPLALLRRRPTPHERY